MTTFLPLRAVCLLALLSGSVACTEEVAADSQESVNACPVEPPSYYDTTQCTDASLVCNYTRADGCPIVRTCDLQGGSGWSFTNHPEDGSACSQPGQECFYPAGDCGAEEYTLLCVNGSWQVSSEPDGCF